MSIEKTSITGFLPKDFLGEFFPAPTAGAERLTTRGNDSRNPHPETGRKYRVLMVAACSFPANYGSPAAIREMSTTLAEMGHEIHVITYPDGDDLPTDGVKVHRVGKPGGKMKVGPQAAKPLLDLKMLWKALRVIRRERIEIIHAHNYEGALIGAVARLLTRRPLVYHSVNLMRDELHTYRFIRPTWLANLLARVLDWVTPRLADEIIAVTPELEREVQAAGKPVTMVPCGIKPQVHEGARPERVREKYKLDGRPVVMYTGVISAFQRIDYLLRAFAIVRQEVPDALLMVVSPLSDEPDLAEHKLLAWELDIKVIWAGPHSLEELKDYLACADVAVVPRCECPGHPIKLLNYMMAGKGIVCFDGAAKGVTHNIDSWIVPDHDWQGLGEGIALLLRDRELATRLGETARENVKAGFDWRHLCEKVEGVYARVGGGMKKV